MKEALLIAAQVAAVIFLVDFLSGVFHWFEDSYASERTPILGRLIVAPNLIHHRQPREFVKSPFWRRNAITMLLSLCVCGAVAYFFGVTWRLELLCLLGAFCNEFHCWAHRSPEENGPVITALHRLRLIQTPNHHAVHHTDPKNRAYCVFTNWTNLLLDKVEFWRRLEGLISFVFRVHPRPDLSVNAR